MLASKMDNLERSAAESEPNIDTDVIDKDRLLEARCMSMLCKLFANQKAVEPTSMFAMQAGALRTMLRRRRLPGRLPCLLWPPRSRLHGAPAAGCCPSPGQPLLAPDLSNLRRPHAGWLDKQQHRTNGNKSSRGVEEGWGQGDVGWTQGCLGRGPVLLSGLTPLSPFVSVLLSLLARASLHCLDPDGLSCVPGPSASRRRFDACDAGQGGTADRGEVGLGDSKHVPYPGGGGELHGDGGLFSPCSPGAASPPGRQGRLLALTRSQALSKS